MSAPYLVLVLDSDGCELGSGESETLKEALRDARYAYREKEYVDAGMRKVEVRNANGVCIADWFVRATLEEGK